jgi:putative hydrolase of the HAD superfamily
MRDKDASGAGDQTGSAVVFDLFGTLVPAYHHRAVLSQMALVLEAPTEEFIHAFAEDTKVERETGHLGSLEENLRLVCRQLGSLASADQIARAAEVRRGFTRDALRPRPDAITTLQALRSRGIRLGLISDCCEVVPPLWGETDLAPLLDTAVFSCRVGIRKPDLRIYERASTDLGVAPSQCLYVGDGGSNELSGATQSGMRAALLLVEAERAMDPYRPEVDSWRGPVIGSLSEVLGLAWP